MRTASPGTRGLRRYALAKWLALVSAVLCLSLVAGSPSAAQRVRTPGSDPDGNTETSGPPGRWRTARKETSDKLSAEQRREVARLRSIGYLSGSQTAPATTGVTRYDREQAYEGLNFYTSGHHAGATLMDMEGNVLHEWRYDFLQAWPDSVADSENDGAEYWRRAHLFENGDVLAIFEGLGMIKVDKDSKLLWSHYGGEHHDLQVMNDGRIYVLTRVAHMVMDINRASPVMEDFITILDSNGKELRSVSLLDAFQESRYANVLKVMGLQRRGDLFHTNAIEVLDGRHADRLPAFRECNVLVSLRKLNVIAVVDMDLEKVVWVLSGMWLEQHDPTLLPNGNILLFDNKGHNGQSKVVEFDPLTQEIAWMYAGGKRYSFYTKMCGANTRLPNGNTLITESDYGRAFEVNPESEIVWEFVNPERAGKSGQLIATLFEVVRLDPDFPTDWLDRR